MYNPTIGETISLYGHLHKLRRMSGFAFLLLRTREAVIQCVWTPDSGIDLDTLREEMALRVRGVVKADSRSRIGWELALTGCEVLASPAAPLPAVINGKRMDLSLEHLLDFRPVTLRNPQQRAIFQVQAALDAGIRAFLTDEGFTQIHSPKLTATSAEGGANVFTLDYFGREASLAQSPQFYKQMMVGVLERVYEIGPVFRAEKHDTARHLNEYTSVDLEMGFIDSFADIMAMETRMLRHALAHAAEACAEALALLDVTLPQVPDAIPRLRFADAKALAASLRGIPVENPGDLDPEDERTLSAWALAEHGSDFLFVTHYPSAKRPFYTMDSPQNPAETESFDLLLRGLEITTGGQRIHDYTMQVEKLRRLGMDPAAFDSYLMAHRACLPPHGGLGLGLERLTARLLNLPNVRQATLFPRDRARLEP